MTDSFGFPQLTWKSADAKTKKLMLATGSCPLPTAPHQTKCQMAQRHLTTCLRKKNIQGPLLYHGKRAKQTKDETLVSKLWKTCSQVGASLVHQRSRIHIWSIKRLKFVKWKQTERMTLEKQKQHVIVLVLLSLLLSLLL